MVRVLSARDISGSHSTDDVGFSGDDVVEGSSTVSNHNQLNLVDTSGEGASHTCEVVLEGGGGDRGLEADGVAVLKRDALDT